MSWLQGSSSQEAGGDIALSVIESIESCSSLAADCGVSAGKVSEMGIGKEERDLESREEGVLGLLRDFILLLGVFDSGVDTAGVELPEAICCASSVTAKIAAKRRLK